MVFLKLVHTQYQVNHKTQLFWVKLVHLVPNLQTLAGHDVVSDGADGTIIAKSQMNGLF